jgi:hypothetical protein
MALGEGWHNYHHTFPYDYKTSEIPYFFNMTTVWIDACATFGLAYDLKSVPEQVRLIVRLCSQNTPPSTCRLSNRARLALVNKRTQIAMFIVT